MSQIYRSKQGEVSIAIVGKYFATGEYELRDSYAALFDALDHASVFHDLKLNIIGINSERQTNLETKLQAADGIIVPIGWGERGVEGKIAAIKYAREHRVPYLGLCYGMQLASVEYARHVLGWKDAHTAEVDPGTKHPIIHDIPFDSRYQRIKGQGASMRLGAFDCVVKPGTLTHEVYTRHQGFKNTSRHLVSERHRHRFEFNNEYRAALEAKGFVVSGTSPDDFFVEMIELPRTAHPFFLGTQGHPEYKSRPLRPHPFFIEFLRAAYSNRHPGKGLNNPLEAATIPR